MAYKFAVVSVAYKFAVVSVDCKFVVQFQRLINLLQSFRGL